MILLLRSDDSLPSLSNSSNDDQKEKSNEFGKWMREGGSQDAEGNGDRESNGGSDNRREIKGSGKGWNIEKTF